MLVLEGNLYLHTAVFVPGYFKEHAPKHLETTIQQ